MSHQTEAFEGKLAVVGLGYVGLPLAVAFSESMDVIGYDVDAQKIARYCKGEDVTTEVGDAAVAASSVHFTAKEAELRQADFVIVAVPTPIHPDNTPDLTPVISASRTVGRNLKLGATVVYESTVYPGVTEELCLPVMEQESGLKGGTDFKIGYSPERINPGDKVHTLRTIRKIVSGMDAETLTKVKSVYDRIIDAGTFPVSSIKTAEAIKLVENSQRDINIAFMNEAAEVFEKIGIDTNEVVDGMNTKWNALGFRPGLVGGHCIGVDPYYFIYKAHQVGYESQIVAAGRRMNDSMGCFVAEMAVKKMVQAGLAPAQARVVILGFTFKENCPDVRNTRVADIVHTLEEYGICPVVVDPCADKALVQKEYGVVLTDLEQVKNADCILHAVAHRQFREMGLPGLMALFRPDGGAKRVLLDVKGEWPVSQLKELEITWWRM